ncbi:MAG: aldehyde ferredoxin oxidoreductase C-terminal domain-containing protein, partial [Pelosinus sp.]|nr:aldehyde ferredoxin oxidoreductase C-terminal domain-containing protein [Pelosinus sp.]
AVYGKTANESGASLQAGCLPGCIISCPKRNNTKNQQGALFKSVLGEILGTNSFEKIADINRLCDDYGVDIMEFSKAVSLAIKAGVLEAGSSQGVIDLVQQLGQNTLLGRVIGSGMEIAGKVFGVFSIDTKQSSHKSSKDTALTAGLIDSMGLCNAITGVLRDNPEGLEGVIEMCNARYGWHKSLHEYLELSR